MGKLKKSKSNNTNQFNIDKEIEDLQKRVELIDYSNGLDLGIKEYTMCVTKLKDLDTHINSLVVKLETNDKDLKDNKIDDTKLTDIEFKETLNNISKELSDLSGSQSLTDLISKYNDIKLQINKCKKYEENIKITYSKVD